MTSIVSNISQLKIEDSVKEKISDAKDKTELYKDWNDLIDNVGVQKVLDEIFQQLSSDELNKLIPSLQKSFDLQEIDDSVKISDDWTEADHAAAFAINADDVVNLYLDGIMELNIPSGIDSKEFAEACINMCEELWSEPEVNFDYGDVKFDYAIDGNKLIITLI